MYAKCYCAHNVSTFGSLSTTINTYVIRVSTLFTVVGIAFPLRQSIVPISVQYLSVARWVDIISVQQTVQTLNIPLEVSEVHDAKNPTHI